MSGTVGRLTCVVLLGVLVVASGCKSGPHQDPIMVLSSAESLAKGKDLMEAGKYRQARDYLVHAFEVEPNSVGGREALLLAADAYFLADSTDNYVRAESRYRDFQTRFPTSDKAAYVQYQIAQSLIQRIKKPDRDQKITRDALAELQSLVELYPTSEYVEQAKEQMRTVRDALAEHELMVGRFYMRYGNLNGAIKRLEHTLEKYPDFDETDQVLFYLGMTHRKAKQDDKAQEVFDRLRDEHPDSPLIHQIPKPRNS